MEVWRSRLEKAKNSIQQKLMGNSADKNMDSEHFAWKFQTGMRTLLGTGVEAIGATFYFVFCLCPETLREAV
jgi:hypothetical protein